MTTQTVEKSSPAIDFNTEAGVRRFLTPKPSKTRASVHESAKMLGLEYKAGSVLRHKEAYQTFVPYFAAIAIVNFILLFAANVLWCIAFSVIALAIVFRLARSTVHIAVTDEMLIVEEHSRFYNDKLEIHRDEIAVVLLLSIRSKHHVEWELRIYRHDDSYYMMPRAGREELNWLSFEICDRLNATRESRES